MVKARILGLGAKGQSTRKDIPGDVGAGQEPVVEDCNLLANASRVRKNIGDSLPARPASVRRSVKPILTVVVVGDVEGIEIRMSESA